jgi:hypothetical protein
MHGAVQAHGIRALAPYVEEARNNPIPLSTMANLSERVAMETTPIGYAFKRRSGPHRVLCLPCCGEVPSLALEVYNTDDDRDRFGVPSDDAHVIVCHECGERLDSIEVAQ